MSQRFKPSKYKNSAPKAMKHEPWIRDLTVGSYNCYSSFIKASAAFTVFNVQPTGSQLGVVSLEAEGVTGSNLAILNAHSDLVTDFDFSPFEDGLLATCSADSTVKIWSITHDNLDDLSLLSPECVTSSKHRRVETVCFHPTAEYLVSYTAQTSLTLWDILHNKEFFHDTEMHEDTIMSISWNRAGSQISTCSKDKMVRIIDPRSKIVAASAISHQNAKDSRVMWLGDSPYILTSGFDSSRIRQIFVRDTRNFDTPVKAIDFDSSTGILLPLFDPDTNMLFIAGRGDSSIAYFEFNSNSKDYLLEGYRYNGEQTKGACLIPKRALKVMETEVNRVLQLTTTFVKNISYYVPRKTYVDFHEDLYPMTRGTSTTGSASSWMDGHNGSVYKISLNPALSNTKSGAGEDQNRNQKGNLNVFKPPLVTRRAEEQASISKSFDIGSSEDLKKSIPEPLPRKKSVSSSGSSSSDEVGDVVPHFFPVPKPRVSTTTSTSGLRTPSQFISRMAADFTHRSISVDEIEISSNNGHSIPPLYSSVSPPVNSNTVSYPATPVNSAVDLLVEPKVNYVINSMVDSKVNPIVESKVNIASTPTAKFTPPKQESKAPELSNYTKITSHKRIDTVFGQVSKYRNFKAAPFHKKLHIENLRNISTTCPGESELIQANPVRVAVPLNTPGGKVSIFELNKPGRQPDGVIPALVHGSKIMDFSWDPFDNSRLAVGDDSGKLWIWMISETGLKEQTNEPKFTIAAHGEKIYFVKFHPLAKDIVATGSYDLSIRIWNLSTEEGIYFIPCHDQIQIFSFAWSPCGAYFATAAKDGKIRIYEPRASTDTPLLEGKGPAGVRGGRVCWALEGRFLIVSGFDRSSERQVHMYSSKDMSKVANISLDVSPAILIPFYDEDSSILFLSGRGDSTIFAFDVIDDSPYLRQLSHHRCPGAHQGISFLKKNALDVQNVEFARAYRLTEVVVEPWSFTVPRVKSEYFQDDLFPPTKVLWEPTMTAEQWINGENLEPSRVSLKPISMKSLGEINGGAGFHSNKEKENANGKESSNGNGKNFSNGNAKASNNVMTKSLPNSISSRMIDDLDNGVKKQQEKLEQAIKSKLSINMKLEQDSMEGVDEEEWNE